MKKIFATLLIVCSVTVCMAQCAGPTTLTLNPVADSTGYPPGTTVTFTLTVNGYAQVGSNWFHGVIVNYGNGWDINSLTSISAAASADGAGVWGFYDSCVSSATGIVYGNGFYYDRYDGFGILDSLPGNNYGDFTVAGTATWTFIWSINVDSTAAINTPLNGSVWATGDGVTGSWISSACAGDIFSFNSLVGAQPCAASFTMSGYPSVLNPITFINTSSGNFTNVLWSFGDSTTSNLMNAIHAYSNVGNNNLCLFISDTSGCADSVCVPLTVVNYISNYNYNSYPYYISGTVYLDADSNGVQGSSETTLNNWAIKLMPGNIISLTNQNGEYYFNVPMGTYTVQPIAVNNWNISSDSLIYMINVDTNYNNSNSYSFGFNPDSIVSSLFISNYSQINFCWSPDFYIDYSNTGTIALNGIISFSVDTFIHFSSAYPSPDSVINETYFWNYSSLSPFNTNEIYIEFSPVDLSHIGDTINYHSEIKAFNNSGTQIAFASDSASQIITCSWDPNSKEVYPVGEGINHITPMNEDLNYTLHFQNTGNDTAFSVILRDTLSPNLDLLSFHFISSSHPCYVHLLPNREVTFEFLNIMLPDSGVNFSGSMGYAKFSILPLDNLSQSTTIENTASIYFDFNTPVITNTVSNLICIPIAPTSISQTICSGDSYYFNGTIISSSGIYSVTLNAINGCDSIVTLNLIVETVNTTIQQSNDTLTATSIGTIQWFDCNTQQIISGATQNIFVPTVTGNYAAIITEGNCTDTSDCVSVIVNSINSITDNGLQFSLFPNPTNETVTVQFSQQVNCKLEITNTLGQIVFAKAINHKSEVINLKSLPSGLYFFSARTEDWKTAQQKLIALH